jgi:hypothetical protein
MKVNIRKYNKGPKERKIDVLVERWDTYSVDHTLAFIMLPLLLQLKDTMQGVPGEFTQSVGSDTDGNYCFDFIQDDQDEVFDTNCKKWYDTLDKIIWSFQQIIDDDYSNKYHHGDMKIGWKPITLPNPITGVVEEMYEMVDENPNEHWYDYLGHQLHEDKIQEGFELFGKYFRSLWD